NRYVGDGVTAQVRADHRVWRVQAHPCGTGWMRTGFCVVDDWYCRILRRRRQLQRAEAVKPGVSPVEIKVPYRRSECVLLGVGRGPFDPRLAHAETVVFI